MMCRMCATREKCASVSSVRGVLSSQPLRDVEQRLELFEIGVPVSNQILIVILPNMH